MTAKILPECTHHSPEEVSRVLTAFGNQAPDREFLARGLLEKLLPDRATDGDQQRIWDDMQPLFAEMQGARRFNRNYLGHMVTEAPIVSVTANLLAAEVGSNLVATEVSMVESRLEHQSIAMLIDIIGYDKGKASGTFCSGGTMANFTALAVARKELEREFERRQVPLPGEVWVLTTEMAHYSIPKAVDLLAGPQHVIKIKAVKTDELKMSMDDLEAKIAEAKSRGIPVMAVVGVMGETETGLVDNAQQINEIAHREGIFTIGDGAYGAPYRLSRVADKFAGLPEYDAVVVDIHKNFWGAYNGSGGAVCFKDATTHAGLAKGVKASYIGINETKDSAEFEAQRSAIAQGFNDGTARVGAKRIEGSGGAGGVLTVKAIVETLGVDGLRTIYDLTLDRVEHLYQRLERSDLLRPCYRPELNLLCFTLRDEVLMRLGFGKHSEEFHDFVTRSRLILDNNIKGEGGYYFSETDLLDTDDETSGNKVWTWRACIMNPWTTDGVVDAAIDNLEAIIRDKLNL